MTITLRMLNETEKCIEYVVDKGAGGRSRSGPQVVIKAETWEHLWPHWDKENHYEGMGVVDEEARYVVLKNVPENTRLLFYTPDVPEDDRADDSDAEAGAQPCPPQEPDTVPPTTNTVTVVNCTKEQVRFAVRDTARTGPTVLRRRLFPGESRLEAVQSEKVDIVYFSRDDGRVPIAIHRDVTANTVSRLEYTVAMASTLTKEAHVSKTSL